MKESLLKGKDSQGRFTQGNQYGRPKGSISRLGIDLRMDAADFLLEIWPQVKAEISKMRGPALYKAWVEVASFVLPKLKATDEPILGHLSEADLDRILDRLRQEIIQN